MSASRSITKVIAATWSSGSTGYRKKPRAEKPDSQAQASALYQPHETLHSEPFKPQLGPDNNYQPDNQKYCLSHLLLSLRLPWPIDRDTWKGIILKLCPRCFPASGGLRASPYSTLGPSCHSYCVPEAIDPGPPGSGPSPQPLVPRVETPGTKVHPWSVSLCMFLLLAQRKLYSVAPHFSGLAHRWELSPSQKMGRSLLPFSMHLTFSLTLGYELAG